MVKTKMPLKRFQRNISNELLKVFCTFFAESVMEMAFRAYPTVAPSAHMTCDSLAAYAADFH